MSHPLSGIAGAWAFEDLIILAVVLLALWKVVDIVVWLCNHVQIRVL